MPYELDPLPPGGGYKVPSQWEYYKAELKKHFLKGQQEGNERFYDEVIANKSRRTVFFGTVTALGLLLASASTPLRKLLHVGILAALLPIPIINANRTIPKLGDAYKVARQGNPKKADRMFNSALREFNYSLFQGFLKPVSYAFAITALIAMPQSFAKPKTQWKKIGEYYLKRIANKLSFKERFTVETAHVIEDNRSLLETALCTPLEWLNTLKAPKASGGKWSEWAGRNLEKLGWKRQYQPYPLLRQLNVLLRKRGDRLEAFLRKSRLMDRLLGSKPDPEASMPVHLRLRKQLGKPQADGADDPA